MINKKPNILREVLTSQTGKDILDNMNRLSKKHEREIIAIIRKEEQTYIYYLPFRMII